MGRIAILLVLLLLLPAWTEPGNSILQFAESKEAAEKAADETADQKADKEMHIGRTLVKQGNHIGALNRFKTVVTRYQASRHAEEAWLRLAESYLTLGITLEAQTAVAVLDRKFPNSRWSAEAHDALKAAGLEP